MSALVGGSILVLVLGMIVLAFTWQGWRRRRDADPVYVLDDAARFAHAGLEPATALRVRTSLVRRILEWQIEYQQVVAPRAGQRAILGSGDAIDHILQRAVENEIDVEARDIAEVIAADVDYLVSIGAVGAPADEEPG